MRKIIISCLFFLALNAAAYCAQASRIEFTDGSVINGEITSYANGVYTINTATFGEIKAEGTKVSKIESANSPTLDTAINSLPQTGNLVPSQIDAYKQRLMSNPENAAVITGLVADPQIQELAKDPEITDALKAGDSQALMKNEKFMNMVNSSKMQEAIKKLKQ